MEILNLLLITITLIALIFLVIILVLNANKTKLLKNNEEKIKKQENEITQLTNEKIRLETTLEKSNNMEKLMETTFQNLANKIFEDKNESLVKNNKQQIDHLLNPLKENIADFKRQFSSVHETNIKERASLHYELKQLQNLNLQLDKDAKSLTKALRGDKSKQGSWGEMILERLLETSGLTKDREYFIQEQHSNPNDSIRKLRPDVIIKMPNNRDIIIDSKVSLNSYHDFVASEDEEAKKIILKSYLTAVKTQIKILSDKSYDQIDTIKSLDYTLMFIPIEPAFQLIVQQEEKLYNDAMQKNIILVSPFNLMVILKTIYNIWNLEKQNKNAYEIADKAGKMYDKFVTFREEFEKIKKSLELSLRSYDNADKLLSVGRGNAINQLEDLRKLGIKNKKNLPTSQGQ